MREKARSSSFMKKLLAIFAALAMVLTMGVGSAIPAMAASDGSITIQNPVKDESYSIYKVFDAVPSDATKDNSDTTKTISYTYTSTGASDAFLTALQESESPFTLAQIGSGNTYNVVSNQLI